MVPSGKVFRIPVKTASGAKASVTPASVTPAPEPVTDVRPSGVDTAPGAAEPVAAPVEPSTRTEEPVRDVVREAQTGDIDWQAVALHLQADAQAYRQRQALRDAQRLAEERERLLLPFLEVVDNLELTLEAAKQAGTLTDDPLYHALMVTYGGMRNLLAREGVSVIEAVGAPFDPTLHEAVALIPGTVDQQVESLVIEELRRGYCQGERVLRPARVIVAQSAA